MADFKETLLDVIVVQQQTQKLFKRLIRWKIVILIVIVLGILWLGAIQHKSQKNLTKEQNHLITRMDTTVHRLDSSISGLLEVKEELYKRDSINLIKNKNKDYQINKQNALINKQIIATNRRTSKSTEDTPAPPKKKSLIDRIFD